MGACNAALAFHRIAPFPLVNNNLLRPRIVRKPVHIEQNGNYGSARADSYQPTEPPARSRRDGQRRGQTASGVNCEYPATRGQECGLPYPYSGIGGPGNGGYGGESPSIPGSRDQYYEKDEVLAALGNLSDTEVKRMVSSARIRLMGNSARPGHVEADDLFNDAVIRTMKLTRRWKRGVTPFTHLFKTMQSIGHQRFKQAATFTPLSETVGESPNRSLAILDAQTSVARLKEQLQGNEVALSVLESMMDDMRPRHAQVTLDISAEVYWAARKRIRRLAVRLRGAANFRRRARR